MVSWGVTLPHSFETLWTVASQKGVNQHAKDRNPDCG
jgi:hypothetical protein